MFAKRLIQKATRLHHPHNSSQHLSSVTAADLDFQVEVHYGIPSTASIISFDPVQRLLAIGTLDGRIKVIGGDNIEGLLISPKQLPYKYLEFLVNHGYLVSISNDNDIQVWNLESRCLACTLPWESNITAFSVINGSRFMYIGDENGLISVLKYEAEDGELLLLPYHISADSLSEPVGVSFPDNPIVVGVLPQPYSSGNRVLIAYDSGLIILWDVVEARVVMVRGDKVLDLKDGNVDSYSAASTSHTDDTVQKMEEKEISASCWASSDGSILVVGYIDGDILFWKTSNSSSTKGEQGGLYSNNVVKLQLSSAEKRLPVIVLHWSSNNNSQNDVDGHLFIYGGDEIGSDEVLTVLSLVWSPGMETLRCIGRADLQLSGSFADMILLPSAGEILNSHNAALFVLTSPGRLNYYDHGSLSGIANHHDKRVSISSVEYPMVVPTVDPVMTVTKLISLSAGGNSSKTLFEILTHLKKCSSLKLVDGIKWPMTGGMAKQLTCAEDNGVGKLYVAGYEDGSVRIWDATCPVLSFLCVLQGEVKGVEVAGSSSSVSKLDFCSLTLCLAVGNKSGLVRLYSLDGSLNETSFRLVTEMKSEAYSLIQGEGLNCRAIFGLLKSPVEALKFAREGAKLAVGYECGRVAVIDMSALSVSFLADPLSDPSSPVIEITWEGLSQSDYHIKSPKISESKIPRNTAEESVFVLTKDAKIYVIHGGMGSVISSKPMHLDSTVISMYVLDGDITSSEKPMQLQEAVMDAAAGNEPSQDTSSGIDHLKTDDHSQNSSKDPLILLCCKDALLLYHTKSVVKGKNKPLRKLKLEKSCCWTTTFKKFEKLCGIVLLYQTGEMEVRSLPDLELVKETSLMSILSWNFKANMDRTMSSTENGQISLANGCEVALISLLASENNFRVPESLPCLHDKVVAAAAEAAFNFSVDHKKRKGSAAGILGGFVKGFKGGKVNNATDLVANSKSNFSQLEQIFKKKSFLDPVAFTTDERKIVGELDIDDIHIDEPASEPSTSSRNVQKKMGTEREQLFDGAAANGRPRIRTREEILATYRKDASSVAGQARDKLVERQEKLERIGRHTEELRNGAEDFASLANELVKVMEGRKWWQI